MKHSLGSEAEGSMFHVKHSLGSEAQAQLAAYVELVKRWAPRLDLVSTNDLADFEQRHVGDSLRALALIASLPPGPAADVGSGAGLPGIPLAIAGHRRLWRLIEPRARRAAFLEECVRALDLDCEVIVADARQAARDPRLRAGHVCALARALAPPPGVFDLLLPLVRPGGIAAVFTSPNQELPPEAAAAGQGLAIIRRVAETDAGARPS